MSRDKRWPLLGEPDVTDAHMADAETRHARAARLERMFEWPILVAALLVTPVIVLEHENISHGWKAFGPALNWIVWLAFATEAAVLLAVISRPSGLAPRASARGRCRRLDAAFRPAGLGELRRLLTPAGVRFAAVIADAAALVAASYSPTLNETGRSATGAGGR